MSKDDSPLRRPVGRVTAANIRARMLRSQPPVESGDERLTGVSELLMRLNAAVYDLAEMPPESDVTVRDLGDEVLHTLDALLEVSGLVSALTSADKDLPPIYYPELLLVARLRAFNVSWARIGKAMNMTASGVHKRYSEYAESLSTSSRTVSTRAID